MKKLKYILIFFLFLVLLLFSCSPAKKLARLHKNNPHLMERTYDTIVYIDTIRDTIEGSKHDTSFHESKLDKDTVFIQNGIVKTLIYKQRDTLYVESETDTVFVEVPIKEEIPYPVYNVEVEENNYESFFFIALLVIYAIIILIVINKIRKPP